MDTCVDCHNEVSTQAATCPNCGRTNPFYYDDNSPADGVLSHCVKCSHQVSPLAKSCPKCGQPDPYYYEQQGSSGSDTFGSSYRSSSSTNRDSFSTFGAIGGCVLGVIVGNLLSLPLWIILSLVGLGDTDWIFWPMMLIGGSLGLRYGGRG